MCIMEIREGQRTSTMVQACLHNEATIRGDLEMLRTVLEARHESADAFAHLDACEASVAEAYALLRRWYGVTIADHVVDAHAPEHHHDDPAIFGAEWAGAERAAEHAVDEDSRRARRYETR